MDKIQELTEENDKLNQSIAAEQATSKSQQQKLQELTKNIGLLRQAYTQLEKKHNTFKEESQHKAQNLESINDQILSLQIENNLLASENAKLRTENDGLIQRWLDKVEKDAEMMNEVMRNNQQ